MIEGIIFLIVVAYVAKHGVQAASEHWQQARGTSRASNKKKSPGRRAAGAVQHDTGYWAHQTARGFPELRHGLAAGWHASRTSYSQGKTARAQALTAHLEHHAGWLEQLREERARQLQAHERIRAARQPQNPPAAEQDQPAQKTAEPPAQKTAPAPWPGQDGEPQDQPPPLSWQQPKPAQTETSPAPQPAPAKGSTTMSGDTTYAQELDELTKMRQDADKARLDILTSMALDPATLSEAADIDDALRQQEKAAQQTLDSVDAAISGLKTRHGGIKQAVDDSPVDKPADPEFYTE
jgi:type IV secretory pathway VirB10-like protein